MRDSTQAEILAAGAIAAFTVDLLVYPLDTIKTRYQSRDYTGNVTQLTSVKHVPSNLFKGLYQGIGSVIFATLPAAAVFFTSYESAKTALKTWTPAVTPQPALHALASAAAELASCAVLTPAEVIKQNAQVLKPSTSSAYNRSSSLEALSMVWRSEAGTARRLWSGYAALAVRNIPFTTLQFPLFEIFRGYLWKWRERRRIIRYEPSTDPHSRADSGKLQQTIQSNKAQREGLGPVLIATGQVIGVSAAISGSLAALITTPLDVVKTRMMLNAGNSSTPWSADAGNPRPQKNIGGLEIARSIIGQHGVFGLFRGAVLRVMWTALGSGLYLGSYEMAKIWLKGGSQDNVQL